MGINCGHCGIELKRIREVSLFDGIERELLQCPKCKAKIYIPDDYWNNYPMILQDINILDEKWMKMQGESFTCPIHKKPLKIYSTGFHENSNN